MSDTTQYYIAAGVFKFDHLTVGFPELKKIAQKWAEEDPHFASLIVRGVSETNYGIDFTYYREFESEEELIDVMKNHKTKLKEKYGDAFYAWDFHKSYSSDKSRVGALLIKHDALIIE